jgi:uncharacterized protein (TIGR01777 family)
MKKCSVRYESVLPSSSQKVWEWLLCPASFERTIPPWMAGLVLGEEQRIDQFSFTLPYGPFSIPIRCKIHFSSPEEGLFAVLEQGLFRYGKYSCKVISAGLDTSFLQEEFVYELPFFLSRKKVEKALKSLFIYRHMVAERDLRRYEKYAFSSPLRLLITGSSGFVGTSLVRFLRAGGHEVVHLHRGKSFNHHSISWDANRGVSLLEDLEGFDAVIHLAGENLAKGFWTLSKKKKILESRQMGTARLVSLLKELEHPPKVFLSASAVGYYENSDVPLTEDSLPGTSFLSQVCQAWEGASKPLESIGTRVVHARFGIILSPRGGILQAILPLFRLGLGGKIGNGKQKMPWVSLDDVVGSLYHILFKEEMHGAVNVVSPFPVSQEVFARTLAEVLHKPCWLHIPRYFLFGEKVEALLLVSQEVVPFRLLQSGFVFGDPELQKALQVNVSAFSLF